MLVNLSQSSELLTKFENGELITLSFNIYTKEIGRYLNSVFTKILSRNNIEFLHRTIETILREMIVNAVKANSKRIYFQHIDLDIHNLREYDDGMKNFKKFLIENKDLITEELQNSPYKVAVLIKKINAGIKVFVQNNSPLHPEELHRVKLRIEKAKEYENFAEVYGDVSDDSEGEGLGIILTMFFLRNSGIGEESFNITTNGRITQSTIVIPLKLKPEKITSNIQEMILEDVRDLPTFPENILDLQRMCKDHQVDIRKLAEKVRLDPSISTAVLKLANSAGFMTMNRIENVTDAIKVIGLKNLNAILISSSAQKIMNERYSIFKEIWKHCYKVAFYARQIALKFRKMKIVENVFLAGMLHDLGKIVLLSTNSKLSEWLSDITLNREIRTSTIIEEVSIGISHTTIGELIARKWNLPEYLVETIKCHHTVLDAREEFREIVYTTDLANKMCGIEEKKYDFFFIEGEVAELFNVNDEDKFNELHESIKELYLKEKVD